MRSPFDMKPWYTPERDGSLSEYLEEHDGHMAMPLFYGYEQFRLLWNEGYLEPGISYIRIMWNIGREDEHFMVRSKTELEGISAPAHGGPPGIYDPKKIFKQKVTWEAHGLRRLRPQARLEDRL